MYTVNKITIGGFRRLESVSLTVNPLIVLIGANGAGKTSFLDALSLLSASASGELNGALSRLGGISSLLTRGKSEALSFEIEMNVPGYEPLEYFLQISPYGTGYSISKEVLSQRHTGYEEPFKYVDSSIGNIRYFDGEKKQLLPPEWEHNPLETSLSQVPKMYRQPEELRRILAATTHYHVLDVSRRAQVKLPQPLRPSSLPGVDGEDLISYLYTLRESDRDRFDAVCDSLRGAFPDFRELNFPPAAAGMLSMTWKDVKFDKPIYIHELSEGTLRFLWLVSLLHSPALSTITMIDEPEVSLHPELLSLLVDLMREASKRTQLVVATHSDRLVRFLEPSEVVVMDIDEEGAATAIPAESMDLDKWLSEYALDEVWRMGCLGGRP